MSILGSLREEAVPSPLRFSHQTVRLNGQLPRQMKSLMILTVLELLGVCRPICVGLSLRCSL